jgi:hypothetical protein
MRRELFPEEEDELKDLIRRFGTLDNLVGDLMRVLKGDSVLEERGFIKTMLAFKEDVEKRLVVQEQKTKGRFTLLIGIAIGVACASVIFGVMTIQQLRELISTIKP